MLLQGPKVRAQKLVHDATGVLLGLSEKDGGLVVWDFGRGVIRGVPRSGLFGYFDHIVQSTRNDIVVIAGPGTSEQRGTVALWNVATGEMIGDAVVLWDEPVASLALTADGTRLAAVADDGKMAVRSLTARGLRGRSTSGRAFRSDRSGVHARWRDRRRREPQWNDRGVDCEERRAPAVVSAHAGVRHRAGVQP